MTVTETHYRLYVDESGDHTFNLLEADNHRFLALLGIWFDSDDPYKSFCRELQELKDDLFQLHPDDPPLCFHRKDIVARRGVYGRLRDQDLNRRFESRLLDLVGHARFCMTCVVLDKGEHHSKTYRTLYHPYHYCTAALLERYAGWLELVGRARGDVMAESRGKTEDDELRLAFETTLRTGTRYHSPERFRRVITSNKIKLKKKEHNIPGLQLADLLVNPLKREMIAERRGERAPADFGAALLDAAQSKLHCRPHDGRVNGYGKVWLD